MSGNKNKTYTKEELLKLIKDHAALPESADDFDKEALEGLKLVKNENLLNELNNKVDELAKQKENKKFIYYISAAASLLLLVGLIFLFKNEAKNNPEKVVADNLNQKQEEIKSEPTTTIAEEKQSIVQSEEDKPKEKTAQPQISESVAKQQSAPMAIATSKDELDQTISEQKNNTIHKEAVETVAANNDATIIDPDTKSGGTVDRESFQQGASKNTNSVISTQAGVTLNEENRTEKSKRSKKVAASLNQPAAYENNNQASFGEQSPASADIASKSDRAEKEEMAKPSSLTGNNYTLPTYINGDSAFVSYAKKHLKISSPNSSGKITVSFNVTKTGKAEKIKVIAPINNCEACSNDVIELIKSIKNWKPATINNKAVDYPKTLVVPYN